MTSRPSIYDYTSPPEFLRELLNYYKSTGSFSLRQRTAQTKTISQGMVSQILSGRRRLNRDNLPSIAAIFKLTTVEHDYLDLQLKDARTPLHAEKSVGPTSFGRKAQNHLLTDWINPYIKDLVHLKGFSSEPSHIQGMLSGLASPSRIKKSTEFLIREGFWRREMSGKIVPNEDLVVTSNEIPNANIRTFHKKALELAKRGVSTLPVTERKASTILVSVNEDKIQELRDMIDSFHAQVLQFVEKNSNGQDKLVQVSMHLTPIGKSNE